MRSIRRPSLRRVAALGLAGATVAVAATAGLTTPANAAVPAPPQLVTVYTVIDVYTNPGDWVDHKHRIGLCYPGGGGTCTINRATAVATNVSVDLGASPSFVAGKIGFSLSRTNSTSVSCSSPKMTSTQKYAGYRVGTRKSYRIQKWQGVSGHPGKLISTSGYLEAFQPYAYPAISCRVE